MSHLALGGRSVVLAMLWSAMVHHMGYMGCVLGGNGDGVDN